MILCLYLDAYLSFTKWDYYAYESDSYAVACVEVTGLLYPTGSPLWARVSSENYTAIGKLKLCYV